MGRLQRRNEKLKDIELVDGKKAVYTGDIYRIAGDGRKTRLRLAAGLALIAALVIASGCIDAAGATNTFYVILPFIGEVSALFALCWNDIKVIAGKNGVRKYVYDSVSGIIPGSSRILAVFALFGLIASGIYLISNGFSGKTAISIIYPVLKAATAVTAEYYGRDYRRIVWETVPKK
ncbi:MAG: hypothetical protein IJL71_02765 [Oscillospiraceae bacterium]|nr:hypothetical protein [Oscillospiraceae bacterium]